MNRIYGKILSREQNAPVPDLIVVAFDLDASIASNVFNLTHLRASDDSAAHATWNDAQRDRLGSTITSVDGTFSLEFDDDLFRREQETEARPDLVVIVLAPEDARVATPGPTHPVDRILAVSASVRAGAGRSEAYIIRIPESRLEELGISVASGGDASEADAQRAIAAVTKRIRFEKTLAEHVDFNAALAPLRTAAKDEAARAQQFALRMARTNLGDGVRRALSPRDRQPMMHTIIDDALPRLTASVPRYRLPISAEQAESISRGTSIQEVVASGGGDLDRIRVRSLLEACAARRACRELEARLEAEVPSSPPTDDGGGDADEERATEPSVAPDVFDAESAQNELNRRLLEHALGRMRYAPTNVDQRQDPLGLRASLDALELRGGPADAVAYHDFHTLQIAFENVWEHAFDGMLQEDISALYESWVRTRKYLDEDAPSAEELDEFRSMTDFLSAVRRDLSAAGSLSERTGSDATWEGNAGGGPWPFRAAARAAARVEAVFGEDERQASRGRARARPAGRTGRRGRRRFTRERSAGGEATTQRYSSEPPNLLARLGRLLEGIESKIREPYEFDVFAPKTTNFGLMVTHRQRWEPESYQVGDLVSTIPLAPGEKRTLSVKEVVKKTRAQTEAESSLRSLKAESSKTSRADVEIVRKATTSTNFKQTANVGFSMGDFLEVGGTSEFSTAQGRESAQTKKAFREAVRKAAEEYKNERKLEVKSTEEMTSEEAQTGEISNPNTEITVTYLFYELQRRYLVSERLHRVRPVILVARDVPKPSDIDEDWLLAHEWILRRVLLDDSLAQAFDYIRASIAGDEFAVEVLRSTWEKNLQVVGEIMAHLESRSALRDEMREKVVTLLQGVENDETASDVAAAIFSGGLSLLFGGGGEASTLEAHREAADRELEFTESEFAEAESRLRQATSALESSSDKYVAAMRTQINRRVMVDQLRIHVKENIIHYMQAIWAHEPPDQRYFQLYKQEVPWFELTGSATAMIRSEAPRVRENQVSVRGLTKLLMSRIVDFSPMLLIDSSFQRTPTSRKLVEVADLDSLLGFKGNYMIFPLKESNPLVDFMLESYETDDVLGLVDPDELGNYDVTELEEVLRCVRDDPEIGEEDRAALKRLLCERMVGARRDVERVIVPSGQLYIEALPGKHPVLEDFKLVHRALDMKKAEAEWNELEYENLRRVSLLFAGDRTDPDIDKRIVVDGADDVIVDT